MAEQTAKRNVVDVRNLPEVAREGQQSAAIVRTEDIATLNTLMKVSQELHQSGMFEHLRNRGQYLAVVLAGNARGYDAMTSLMNIHIVNGRLGMSGQMIATELRKAGVKFQVLETTTERCRIRFSRNGEEPFEYEFTAEDARRAGKLPGADKSVWKSYPQDMLYWRCLTAGARRYAPDAIMGLYLKDEIDDLDVTRQVHHFDIEAEPEPDPPTMEAGDPATHQPHEKAKAAPETAKEPAPEAEAGVAAETETDQAAEPTARERCDYLRAEIVKLEAAKVGEDIALVRQCREKNIEYIDLDHPDLLEDEALLAGYRDELQKMPDRKSAPASGTTRGKVGGNGKKSF